MDEVEGMSDAFKRAKIVFFTTYTAKGEEHTRPLTNFNEDPYRVMWFATDASTRKIGEIKANRRVLVNFQGADPGVYYEVEGQARLGTMAEVKDRWVWWWLYWHPHEAERYFTPQTDDFYRDKAIIFVEPLRGRRVEGTKVSELTKKMPRF